jgi:hypothetical protein
LIMDPKTCYSISGFQWVPQSFQEDYRGFLSPFKEVYRGFLSPFRQLYRGFLSPFRKLYRVFLSPSRQLYREFLSPFRQTLWYCFLLLLIFLFLPVGAQGIRETFCFTPVP